MNNPLRERIQHALLGVIDPETSMDVLQMRLVRDLEVKDDGEVILTFRPSSVMCPLGFSLGADIKQTIQAVDGVKSVRVKVEGYAYARQLEQLLEQMEEGRM